MLGRQHPCVTGGQFVQFLIKEKALRQGLAIASASLEFVSQLSKQIYTIILMLTGSIEIWLTVNDTMPIMSYCSC